MKLIFKKSDLANAVNTVSKAVASKTTMTILQCILIDASASDIKFTANDMELGIETIVEGDVIERGQIAIEAKIFSDIVRKLPDSEITIETDQNLQMTITSEKARFVIPCKSGEDFSYIPFIEKDNGCTISQFMLKEIIRQTIFSIASDDNNKIMTGELFEIKDQFLKVVSLDGHRISIRNIELKEYTKDTSVIVPGKALNEICKILNGGNDDYVKIYFTNNHILFEFNQTTVVSRLIEGEYFRVNQMISSDYETKITVNKRELLESIDRATLLVKEGDKRPIVVNIEDGVMKLQIDSPYGSMNENIIISKEGKDILIGFNPKYLLDALRVIDDEDISIYLLNSKSPCYIMDDNKSYIYLVLPVNL